MAQKVDTAQNDHGPKSRHAITARYACHCLISRCIGYRDLLSLIFHLQVFIQPFFCFLPSKLVRLAKDQIRLFIRTNAPVIQLFL